MARPLLQHGIRELEELFSRSKQDLGVLRNLESELRHRQVPKARSLLHQVRLAIKVGTATSATESAGAPAKTSVQQPSLDLFKREPAEVAIAPAPEVNEQSLLKGPVDKEEETPMISLSDAYRLLKATASSDWELIERLRRDVVQRASPALEPGDKRLKLQQEADKINNAYRIVAASRSKSR